MQTLDKPTIRTEAFRSRAAISRERAASFASRLAALGPDLARAHGARDVSAFASIGDEIDTAPLIAALHEAGFRVGLPVTGRRGTPLVFRRWMPDTPMIKGRMDIPEPPSTAEMIEPDVLFVPLAAFDRRGHRIGYGAGFFDATLAALRQRKSITAVGLAYSGQEVLFIPNEDHDECLDFVVTEKETIVCSGAA
jgi:5-formyltetrahydrofolate cyclo-ligase